MTPAAATLDLWDTLAAVAPPARGAAVLVARGVAPDLVAAGDVPLAVAAREALVTLRDRVGPVLDTTLACPACEALLDVPLPLDQVLAGSAGPPLDVDVDVDVDGVVVRGPTTSDVLAALASADPAATLRAQCVTWPAGSDPDADADLAARVAATAEQVCGLAGTSLRLHCPECGREVVADVDAVGLLTERVAEEARDVLADVATLAAAFGWSEREVLALPPSRWHAYLGLVGAQG
ncbi:hypothetical protein Q9S36_30255 [Microbacterium sp. ARD31]|uniref:hypothetical protein n=1 Tax=Microbacterium sp. ARD31 TaxID=2962576 RepID=UPI0028822BF9|nr:hypothetical protein [Microbacterium sp. ARD31]MDT0184480.1 hypothetical protein [Microbacterium sp. ARD31]